jgi:hypothetical protein
VAFIIFTGVWKSGVALLIGPNGVDLIEDGDGIQSPKRVLNKNRTMDMSRNIIFVNVPLSQNFRSYMQNPYLIFG